MKLVFDIETDDYLNDWTYEGEIPVCLCLVAKDIKTGTAYSGLDTGIFDVMEIMSKADVLIGHNIIGYDLPFLYKFYGWEPSPDTRVIDTYVLSRLICPEDKPQGLDAWGTRFDIPKPKVLSFKKATPSQIQHRCTSDVDITTRLYNYLLDRAKGKSFKQAYALEAEVQRIITEQEEHGVSFDIELAKANYHELTLRMEELEQDIEPRLPPRKLPKSQLKFPPKLKFRKDGSPSARAQEYFKEHNLRLVDGVWLVDISGVSGPMKRINTPIITHAPMKLINRADIKEWLLTQGWKPTFWNTKDGKNTTPKIQDNGTICPNLLALGGKIPDIKKVTLWNTYQNRKNVIYSPNGAKKTGLLAHPRLNHDGRLPAGADTLGAVTRRMTHKIIANVPRTTSVFGGEMRSMFKASAGMGFVGWDASGLEDRVKAHYLYPYDPEYVRKLLDPEYDPHNENTLLWFGLTPNDQGFNKARSLAKNGLYALIYGCTAPKLALTLKVSPAEGQRMYDAWWSLNEPLMKLKEDTEKQWRQNGSEYLIGLDGAPIITRKPHALLNTLFQSAGIIIMKQAMVWWHNRVKELNLEAYQVIHYHDEAQAEALDHYTATVAGQLGVDSIVEAGKMLKLNVPLDGEYKIGKNWSETH